MGSTFEITFYSVGMQNVFFCQPLMKVLAKERKRSDHAKKAKNPSNNFQMLLLALASLLLLSQLPLATAAPAPAPAPAPLPAPAPAPLPAPFVPPFNLFIRLLGGLGGGANEANEDDYADDEYYDDGDYDEEEYEDYY